MFKIIEDNERNKLSSNFDRRLNIRKTHNPFDGYSRIKN